VDSLVQHPASLTHRPVEASAKPNAGVVRLSIGLEHVDDLAADILQALDAVDATDVEDGLVRAAEALPQEQNA
ncbi:MAG TPA: PLP-dependent transferase, partial [Microterricola sp.]